MDDQSSLRESLKGVPQKSKYQVDDLKNGEEGGPYKEAHIATHCRQHVLKLLKKTIFRTYL